MRRSPADEAGIRPEDLILEVDGTRVERVEALAEYGITLKILGSVQAVDQWAAAGELRKRLLAAFTREGIEIPRPQRVVLARDPDGPGPRPPEVIVGPDG